MATLSRKTLGLASRMIAQWTRTSIEQFLYENDIPNELVVGSSKVDMVLTVFKALEGGQHDSKLLDLVEAAVPRIHPDERRHELEKALVRDGFVIDGGFIVESDPLAQEHRTAVEVLLGSHEDDLDTKTLLHHLHESRDLFRREKWDSSIGQCRNFVEQLLKDMAASVALARNETPDLSRPVRVRQYLQDVGFLDNAERQKLVDGVYGYFSEEGSHPGISTQSAARVASAILASCSFYLLEKFDAWKNGEMTLL